MKTLVLILMLCACPCIVQAQTAPIIARAVELRQAEKFADAQKLLEAQLAKTKGKAGRDKLQNAVADVHFDRAEKLRERADFQNAIAHYRKAYASDKVLRPGNAADDLTNIGVAYDSLRRYEDALRYFNQALPIYRKVKDRNAEAITLGNIGSVYINLSRYEEALRYYEKTLTIYRALPDSAAPASRKSEADTLISTGWAYEKLSRYEDALRYYEKALAIYREVENGPGEANTLNSIGGVYLSLSRYEDALRFTREALLIAGKAVDEVDMQGEINALNTLGGVYEELKSYGESLRYYQQALRLSRENEYRKEEGQMLNNIGVVYEKLNRPEDSLRCYRMALPIVRKFNERSDEAFVLASMGEAYSRLGRHQEALRVYWKALAIFRESKDRRTEAIVIHDIGLSYQGLQRYAQALYYFQYALPIRRQVKDRHGEADTLGGLMEVRQAQKLPGLAIIYGKQAINLYQSMRRDMRGLDKTSRDAFLKGNGDTYQTLARLLINQGRFTEAEEVLAMVQQQEFLEFVRRDARGAPVAETTADYIGAEKTVVAEQNAQIESVAKLAAEAFTLLGMEKPTAAQTARLAQVRQSLGEQRKKLDAFFAALPARFGHSATEIARDEKELSAIVPLLREMGKATGSKVALISAFADSKGLELLLTLPSGPTLNLSYAAGEQSDFPAWLNAQIFAFKRDIIKRAPIENQATALWNVVGCHGALSAQLESAGIDTIMWRLTGSLSAIPLAALRDKDGYLVEKYRNVVLTAGSSELNLAHQPVENWRALGVGVTKAWTVEGDQFKALSGVEGELQAVMDAPADGYAKGVLPGRVLRDETFSESSFFRLMRGADAESNAPWQVVHIASHFKLAGDDLKSFLLTGDGKALTLAALRERAQNNPLFPGVELMTLSACDTASGAGNLGALAEKNGAKAVLATLWPVADQETAQLMADFYANHAGAPTAGKAVALQKAQLKLLHAGGAPAHPYYWAPFVLMGNWR